MVTFIIANSAVRRNRQARGIYRNTRQEWGRECETDQTGARGHRNHCPDPGGHGELFLGNPAGRGAGDHHRAAGGSAAPAETAAAEASPAPEQTEDVFPIDLNTATVDELQLLPSIGEVRAQAIVDYREANGPFTYVEDLRNVKGIGEGILSAIMDYATVGGTTDG